jgi:hypothetical protein
MDVTITYTGSTTPPSVTELATDLFGGTLFIDTATPGAVHLLGVSFDPLPAYGSFATIAFDAASSPVITGITVNSFTDASPSTVALPTRVVIRNP